MLTVKRIGVIKVVREYRTESLELEPMDLILPHNCVCRSCSFPLGTFATLASFPLCANLSVSDTEAKALPPPC
jgi:hypothetical protein